MGSTAEQAVCASEAIWYAVVRFTTFKKKTLYHLKSPAETAEFQWLRVATVQTAFRATLMWAFSSKCSQYVLSHLCVWWVFISLHSMNIRSFPTFSLASSHSAQLWITRGWTFPLYHLLSRLSLPDDFFYWFICCTHLQLWYVHFTSFRHRHIAKVQKKHSNTDTFYIQFIYFFYIQILFYCAL